LAGDHGEQVHMREEEQHWKVAHHPYTGGSSMQGQANVVAEQISMSSILLSPLLVFNVS